MAVVRTFEMDSTAKNKFMQQYANKQTTALYEYILCSCIY